MVLKKVWLLHISKTPRPCSSWFCLSVLKDVFNLSTICWRRHSSLSKSSPLLQLSTCLHTYSTTTKPPSLWRIERRGVWEEIFENSSWFDHRSAQQGDKKNCRPIPFRIQWKSGGCKLLHIGNWRAQQALGSLSREIMSKAKSKHKYFPDGKKQDLEDHVKNVKTQVENNKKPPRCLTTGVETD